MPGYRQTTPVCRKGILKWRDRFIGGYADFQCEVGSPAWFLWLDAPGRTTFYYDNVVCEFTARREKRRKKYVWYAFKTKDGITYKAYLGPSHLVDRDRLAKAASDLYDKI